MHEALEAAGVMQYFRWPHVYQIPNGTYGLFQAYVDGRASIIQIDRDNNGNYSVSGPTPHGLQNLMYEHFYVARYYRDFYEGGWVHKRTVRIVE